METLEELKEVVRKACDFHVEYFATSGKNSFYFSYVPDVDGCDMFAVGEDGELIETDMDSVCIYGFDSFRSLSDIKRIIELMEATQGLFQVFSGVQDGYWLNELDAARRALGYK